LENSENDKKSTIKNFFKFSSSKVKTTILVVLIIVVLIIFASSFTSKTKTTETSIKDKNNSLAYSYCQEVENRLEYVLKSVKGIGNVEVFIMVDASPTIKYLEETNTTTNNEGSTSSIQTTIVLAKNGTITEPVVVVEILPKITGVLLVATGAKDIKMKTTLINTVSAILDVDISSVEVLEGK